MKNKAVFLDRDGVIVEDKNHIHKKEDLILIPGSVEAIKIINNKGYIALINTNQSAVARGLCTLEKLIEMNHYLEEILQEQGAIITKTYFCPHHPTEGKDPKYTKRCECRKPGIGMIIQALEELNIYLPLSYVVGDKKTDIKSGRDAGCKTVLVRTGYNGKDNYPFNIQPDMTAKNLLGAANLIK